MLDARKIAFIVAACLLVSILVQPLPAAADDPITIPISSTSPGDTFDGLGAESAAGASRLLIDYPTAYPDPVLGPRDVRAEVLDYMFCNPNSAPADPAACPPYAGGRPAHGAAWPMLKVEIGGDTDSSVGSEPSFLRAPAEYAALVADFAAGDLSAAAAHCHFDRGYEWWLMREARARNAGMRFSSIVLGAPAYLRSAAGDLFSEPADVTQDPFTPANSIGYFLLFAQCAELQGTALDTMGIWNEVLRDLGYQGDYTPSWLKGLRRALNDAEAADRLSRHVRIICCDHGWRPDSDGDLLNGDLYDHMAGDLELAAAVDVIGVHYPDDREEITTGHAPDVALGSGKTLWASEDAPGVGAAGEGDWPIGRKIIKLINVHRLRSRTTANVFVNPFLSSNNAIALADQGLAKANTPWSGNYTIQAGSWLAAHVNQATQPGWTYVDEGSCFIGAPSCSDPGSPSLDVPGSYVTWRDPATGHWTTVLETINSTGAQAVRLCPAAGDAGVQHPAEVNVAFSDESRFFDGHPSIPVDGDGCYQVTVAPESVYTFTTLSAPLGPFHGSAPEPPPASTVPIPSPNPFLEDFDGTGGTISTDNCSHPTYDLGDTPCWTSDVEGVFEVADCASPRSGRCLEQVITDEPIRWRTNLNYGHTTVVGDVTWAGYDVSARYRLGGEGAARLQGYVSPSCEGLPSTGCFTIVSKSYSFDVGTDGSCTLSRFDPGAAGAHPFYAAKFSCGGPGTLSFDPGTWHTLGMRLQNVDGVPHVTVYFDGQELGTYQDTEGGAIFHGAVAFGTANLVGAQFDDLCVSITASCAGVAGGAAAPDRPGVLTSARTRG
jgi:Glycosyl hydrolase family 59